MTGLHSSIKLGLVITEAEGLGRRRLWAATEGSDWGVELGGEREEEFVANSERFACVSNCPGLVMIEPMLDLPRTSFTGLIPPLVSQHILQVPVLPAPYRSSLPLPLH